MEPGCLTPGLVKGGRLIGNERRADDNGDDNGGWSEEQGAPSLQEEFEEKARRLAFAHRTDIVDT
jgi:hypothetical protein